ncbi:MULTISPECIES: flavin reductase family protein [Nonomuraea]|uniref:Flavin reductase family protein n=2 Tax=Nonomuraea TaxID=83681 RepID=A0ABW1BMV1_9ACTN|nr:MULTISPECIES: flavin reductase family protein [Nonomuraea]MDA0642150.1 flavin reductase family protein [Nonomuraea ferruginea]TXK39562.1 flavin reductase family protein [Nonomuraea sp. C10]
MTPLAESCRAFMSAYPTGVAVVTAMSSDGEPCGLTCSSLISVTLTPPTLLVSMNVHSRTLAATVDAGGFGVNLLPARSRPAAELFSSLTADRFSAIRWAPAGPRRLPRLEEDLHGWAECAVEQVLTVGDHAVVLGRVVDIASDPESPLMYGFREYATWHRDAERTLRA